MTLIKPLVSVVVITYNSAKYILAGLKSIENQTYDNIEVIISDDCSTDNTIDICKEWINKNKNKFQRVELIETNKNTGVAGNLNRGINASKGEWIKTLSGDDMFSSELISHCVEYVSNHKDCSFAYIKPKLQGNDYKEICKHRDELNWLYKEAQNPHKMQLITNFEHILLPGPGWFYKRSVYDEIGGFDERFQSCEENPFMTKVLLAGYKVSIINKEDYIYNVRNDSLGRLRSHGLSRYDIDLIKYYKTVEKKILKENKLYLLLLQKSSYYKYRIANAKRKKNAYIFLKIYNCISIIRKLINH